jgi:predicted cupin superfamily sugar epimerase
MNGEPELDGLTAEGVIALLGMDKHREGGAFRETFRDPHTDHEGRPRSTAIYYLLKEGERSHWHTVDASEVWHHYAGAPMTLAVSVDGVAVERVTLGRDLANGARPQAVVPAGAWQSAAPVGGWSLVGCTVAPGFSFDGFDLAPPDWEPGQGPPKTQGPGS